MSFAHGETITRERGVPVADPYSGEDTELDWTAPEILTISGVAVVEGPTSELPEVGRDPVTVDYTLYTPYQVDILPKDRLIVRGQVCQVQGIRIDWHNPFTGSEPGSEVRARRVLG